MIEVNVNYHGRSYGFHAARSQCKIQGYVSGDSLRDMVRIGFLPPDATLSPSALNGSGYAHVGSAELSLTVMDAEQLACKLTDAIAKARQNHAPVEFLIRE